MVSLEAIEAQKLHLSFMRPSKANKNRRKRCSCGHATTKNQRKFNGNVCHHCKEPFYV